MNGQTLDSSKQHILDMDASDDYIIVYMYYESDENEEGPQYFTQIFYLDDNFIFKLKMTLPSYEN